jgi:hypothetical protein
MSKQEPDISSHEEVEAVAESEPAGTTEVAGEPGIERQSADCRLRCLLDEERVSNKKVRYFLVWSVENESIG